MSRGSLPNVDVDAIDVDRLGVEGRLHESTEFPTVESKGKGQDVAHQAQQD